MGALSSLATVGLNFALAQQASRRQSQAISSDRDRQIQQIQQRDAEAERERRERLRRQLAAQRARAGAAGVGGGGSADAVLRGLVEEAEAEARASGTESGHRIGDIRRRAHTARQRNLLDLVGTATQSGVRTLSSSSRRGLSLLDL